VRLDQERRLFTRRRYKLGVRWRLEESMRSQTIVGGELDRLGHRDVTRVYGCALGPCQKLECRFIGIELDDLCIVGGG
jgi:hypothetical protein